MHCEVRGDRWPDAAADDLVIGGRLGVDLSPVEAADAAATDWLRSCIWPEHVDRLARLDGALAEVSRVRPRLLAAEMVDALPAAVSDVDPGVLPCVFSSHALTYLPAKRRAELVELLGDLGAGRDLALVLNEASECGAELFLDGPPAEAGPAGVLSVGVLTAVVWRDGRPGVEVLARTGPHGAWLEWLPRRYPYAP